MGRLKRSDIQEFCTYKNKKVNKLIKIIILTHMHYIQLNFKQNQMITPLLQCQKQLLLHIQMNAVIHFIKRQDSEQVNKILTEQNTSADALLKICIQNKFAHLAYMLFNYTDYDASQFIDFLFKCFSPDQL
ncbi:Conserved_hypothetical protein [Hexamita inflata]|uniref:Uncharacterized protein n=1 Tax=Hexamita inflata TaxID=28002 RepID=A0AA86ULD2_9EUKA|nr:Conserved hypothetical protein [Hexamita inflata]